MSNRLKWKLPAAAMSLLPGLAFAATQIPLDTFAHHPGLSTPRLSPDGQHLALRVDDNESGSHALVVYQISDMSHPISYLRMPKYQVPGNIVRVSPTRLVVEEAKEYGSIDKPELTGEILATNLDGKHQDYLYGSQPYHSRSGRFFRATPAGLTIHPDFRCHHWGSVE